MPFPHPPIIYYKFTQSVYNDNQCSIFNHSDTETNYCLNYKYMDIDKCCNHIAKTNNVTLDLCSNFIQYTCDYDSETETRNILGFFAAFGILCIVVICIYFWIYLYIYCCDKRCGRHTYESI